MSSDEKKTFFDLFTKIEVNEEEIAKHPYKPRNLRHYTGTLTDIRPKDDTVYYFKGLEYANEKR